MQAIGVRRGESRPALLDVPRPEPAPDEALVRVLRVGVDGTDHEVLRGAHGGFPAGEDHLVLGHEAVGVVEDPNDTALAAGDVVVPTVRRPPAGPNPFFERGEPDMAPPGAYVERGIEGAHGFMAEYVTSPEDYLVPIPRELAEWGFLIEPISVTEKAMEFVAAARSSVHWAPETALVLGNGSLGLLTLAMLDVARTYCLGRRDRPDPTIDLIESLGGTYVDGRETPVPEIPAVHGPMDVIYEATGHPPHAFEGIEALAPNGVLALLGVPEDRRFEVNGGRLHRSIVLENKAVVGSVNSRVAHFEAAAGTLAGLPEPFLRGLVTGVHPVGSFERAFVDDDTTIKTAVEFDAP